MLVRPRRLWSTCSPNPALYSRPPRIFPLTTPPGLPLADGPAPACDRCDPMMITYRARTRRSVRARSRPCPVTAVRLVQPLVLRAHMLAARRRRSDSARASGRRLDHIIHHHPLPSCFPSKPKPRPHVGSSDRSLSGSSEPFFISLGSCMRGHSRSEVCSQPASCELTSTCGLAPAWRPALPPAAISL